MHAVEVADLSGLPAGSPQWRPTNPAVGTGGGIDLRHQNLMRYSHTFGDLPGDAPRDSVFNRGVRRNQFTDSQGNVQSSFDNTRLSAHDGLFMVPLTDIYYQNDPEVPGVFGYDALTKMKYYRDGIQVENLIAVARRVNPAATNALLDNFYPVTPFDVGAGANGNAAVFGERSFVNGPSARRWQDDISGDQYERFKRELMNIIEN